MNKRIVAFLLVFCLAAGHFVPASAFGGFAYAETSGSEETVTQEAEPAESQEDDGTLWRMEGEGSEVEEFYGASTFARSISVKHNSRFDGYDKYLGIDVSSHNGTINWTKVAADGIDFAIIRMGYRGYASAGNMRADTQGAANLKNAKAAGLDVGVYFFSQAITTAEAVEEAEYLLELIEGYDIDLPVVMDFEYTGGSAGRLTKAGLSDRQRTNICIAFCETIEDAGYEPMVYANRSMLTNDLYASEIAEDYEIWLAEWGTSAAYKGEYSFWQYSSSGSVNGVPSARVDMNYRYVLPGASVASKDNHSITLKWTEVADAEGYFVYRKTSDTDYVKVGETTDLTFKDTGLDMGASYTYMISCYNTADGQQTEFDSGLSTVKATTSATLKKPVPTGKGINAGAITLNWNKVEDADGYEIQRYNSSKKAYTTVKTVTDPDQLTYTNTGRLIGTTYKYRMRAYAVVNGKKVYSSYSSAISVKTATKLESTVLTAEPVSYTTNQLTWDKVSGAKGYKIQRYNSSTKKYVTIKTITSGTTTSYKNTYLNADTTYKYRIRPYATLSGKTVYGSYSGVVSATTLESVKGKVTTSKLSVRKGASTKYSRICYVKKGRELTITGSRSGWYRISIKVNGKTRTGYVSKKYVKLL